MPISPLGFIKRDICRASLRGRMKAMNWYQRYEPEIYTALVRAWPWLGLELPEEPLPRIIALPCTRRQRKRLPPCIKHFCVAKLLKCRCPMHGGTEVIESLHAMLRCFNRIVDAELCVFWFPPKSCI